MVGKPGATPESRPRGDGCRARATSFGTLLLGTAGDAVHLIPEGEIEGDLGGHRGLGKVTPHVPGIALTARGLPIERKTHGVEDRRLASAGRPMDQEEGAVSELAEIQHLLSGIGSKRMQRKLHRPHGVTSRSRWRITSTTVVYADASAVVSSEPVTSAKKAANN